MKTKAFFFVAIFVAFSLAGFSTVYTVSNLPQGGAQYSLLNDAYDAASDGDTLILEGTNIAYYMNCNVIWVKQLTVLGAGFNTDKQNFKKTLISNTLCQPCFCIGNLPDGGSFHGISFIYKVRLYGNVNNLTFGNCEFNGGNYQGGDFSTNNYTANGLLFRNCVFSYNNGGNVDLGPADASNIMILNCVFDGSINGRNNSLLTLLVDHCIFLGPGNTLYQVNEATVSNSIFMNAYPTGATNTTFLNNICRVAGTFPPAGNYGSANIENADPQLVNYTFNTYYDPTHDYDVQAGSPCELAGSDGTDIGIHGGTSKFSEQGESLIAPVVRAVMINNPVVAPNGTLNVDVSASKPAED